MTDPIQFVSGLHIPSLEAFHDHLLDSAAEMIGAGKAFPSPTTYVLSKEGQLAVIHSVLSPERAASYQQAVVKTPIVRACAVVFEAWVSQQAKVAGQKRVRMPRDDPNRSEALVVSLLTAGRQAMTFSPIERPANIVRKAPFKWVDESEGAFGGRFVRDGVKPA